MHRLLVLYGSQTGHAADAAERVASGAARRGWSSELCSMETFDVATLPSEPRVVFIVSTAGDGEFPDAALRFWRFLARADVPAGALSQMRAAVFGLGDSSYSKFNVAARKLGARLAQLGATTLCARALGDWQAPLGIVGALDAWLTAPDGLWAALAAEPDAPAASRQGAAAVQQQPLRVRFRVAYAAAVSASAFAEAEAAFPFPWPVRAPRGLMAHRFGNEERAEAADRTVPLHGIDGHSGFEEGTPLVSSAAAVAALEEHFPPLVSRCTGNARLTAAEWGQDVRMLSFEHWVDPVRGCAAVPAWEAGDVAELWVENPPEAVSALASRLNLQLDAIVRIEFRSRGSATALGSEDDDPRLCAPVWATDPALPEPPRPAASFPHAVSVRTLLARYLAISAAPARGALEALAAYARNPEQTAKLIELAGAEGAKLYHAYITSEARTWADVLHDFDSIDAPLAVLLEHIPRLSPRAFSIASACLPSSRPRLDLAVGIVAWKTPLGTPRMGTASAWLAALREGDAVALCVRRGGLRAPSGVPLLLIGPGTGVAPMRALVQAAEAAQSSEVILTGAPLPLPPRVELFFGCRSQASDHLFGPDFSSREASAASGHWRGLNAYVPAFSRDGGGPGPGGRAYVQDYLTARADSVRALIASGAHIRIAGSAKRMPADVLEALRNILAGPGGTAADGARALAILEKQGRLAIEAWS